MKARRWLVWSLLVVGWTLLLTFPVPQPLVETTDRIVPGRRYVVAKTVHVCGYALLAALAGWLAAPRGLRLLLLLFLTTHAAATELVQKELAYRDGTIVDVLFNHLGVLIGLLVAWKWWNADAAGDP